MTPDGIPIVDRVAGLSGLVLDAVHFVNDINIVSRL
jgi:hypothetical protein